MKRKEGILIVILAAVLTVFAYGKTADAATTDASVWNFVYDTSVSVNVGDNGTLRPVTENLVDSAGLPLAVSSWSYDVYDTSVIQVDANGSYQAVGIGETTVNVRGYDEYYHLVFSASAYFTVNVNMSNVTLETDKVKGYVCGYEAYSTQIKLLDPDGVSAVLTEVSCLLSNTNMSVYCELQNNLLTMEIYGTGNTTATINIAGKTFTVNISVSSLEINKRSYVTSKGKKTKLKIKGTSDKPVWSSSNKKVAKVSSDGTVRFRKKGNAVITADFNGKKVGCAVSVISPKLMKVVKRAKKMGSTWKYSQAKRMQKGYYDCSSLVWRSYALMGKKFGASNWAPVAADLAKWCKKNGKVLTKSYTRDHIQKMKFRPGDLMFETGKNNGRYKGIYHVEMFVGYAVAYYDASGKPVLNELWAARPEGYYGGGHLIERP